MVIYNGPSRKIIQDLSLTIPLIGCNFAYRDFEITDCVAIDRMTVSAIRSELGGHYTFRCWTKPSSLPLPDGWREFENPGIDSGSLAVNLALRHSHRVMVVGCDGIMRGSTESAYEYRWHSTHRTKNIHLKHRSALVNLTKKHGDRILCVWPEVQNDLNTCDFDQALDQLSKYQRAEKT